MRILVLGASGFIGRHLVENLCAEGHAVEAWCRNPTSFSARVVQQRVDLLQPHTFASHRGPWDAAIHLAAHAVPGAEWTRARILENLTMTAHALDHLARVQPGLRVVLMSSAAVYAPGSHAHTEDETLAPENGYGLSKQLCETWASSRHRDLDIRVARAFNHIGAQMPRGLFVTDLLERLSVGEGPIEMSGADSLRDFVDVRDGVRALEKLCATDAPSGSVFNVCTGQGRRVSELAQALVQRLRVQREIRFRPGPAACLVGSPAKLVAASGWEPHFSLTESIDAILAGRPAHAQ